MKKLRIFIIDKINIIVDSAQDFVKHWADFSMQGEEVRAFQYIHQATRVDRGNNEK